MILSAGKNLLLAIINSHVGYARVDHKVLKRDMKMLCSYIEQGVCFGFDC